MSAVTATPAAFRDPPLLNATGAHEPRALRGIGEVAADEGRTGLRETCGDQAHSSTVRAAADRAGSPVVTGRHGLTGAGGNQKTAGGVFSRSEVACLDIPGKAAGRPVAGLLGGPARPAVPYSAYLFSKRDPHPGGSPGISGAVQDPDGIAAQARPLIGDYGPGSIKLKGGVFPPDEETAAVRALTEAFPGVPLRLAPSAARTFETSVGAAADLAGVLECPEDPTPGIDGTAEIAARSPMPLATSMRVVASEHLPPAIAQGAVGALLIDHRCWGGLRHSVRMAALCRAVGMKLSMHSSSHPGISLAATTHPVAAVPDLQHSCYTHAPWQRGQAAAPGALRFTGGAVAVPDAPGPGAELDRDASAAMHEQHRRRGITRRGDTACMRRFAPDYQQKARSW